MNISQLSTPLNSTATTAPLDEAARLGQRPKNDPTLREAFDSFVGETFYSQMLGAMRKLTSKPAYFHGGRAEEVFQGQLDQILSEKMTEASAGQFTGPMFELFNAQRTPSQPATIDATF